MIGHNPNTLRTDHSMRICGLGRRQFQICQRVTLTLTIAKNRVQSRSIWLRAHQGTRPRRACSTHNEPIQQGDCSYQEQDKRPRSEVEPLLLHRARPPIIELLYWAPRRRTEGLTRCVWHLCADRAGPRPGRSRADHPKSNHLFMTALPSGHSEFVHDSFKRAPYSTSRYEFSLPQKLGTFGAKGSFHHTRPSTKNLYSYRPGSNGSATVQISRRLS